MTMNFNLENSDSDKFDHLGLQMKVWAEDTDQQIVFLTIDHRKLVCSSKVISVFSDLIRDIVTDINFYSRQSSNPIFISVPYDLHVMTCIYQLLLNGVCEGGGGDSTEEEIINAGTLLNINIMDLQYEPLNEENANLIAVKMEPEDDYSDMFIGDGLLDGSNISEGDFHDSVQCQQSLKFPCTECGKVFGRKDVMMKHMRNHGITKSEPNGVSFNCTECENSYSSRDKLTRHMLQHTVPDGKPFECLICETSFSRKDALTRHRKKKNH